MASRGSTSPVLLASHNPQLLSSKSSNSPINQPPNIRQPSNSNLVHGRSSSNLNNNADNNRHVKISSIPPDVRPPLNNLLSSSNLNNMENNASHGMDSPKSNMNTDAELGKPPIDISFDILLNFRTEKDEADYEKYNSMRKSSSFPQGLVLLLAAIYMIIEIVIVIVTQLHNILSVILAFIAVSQLEPGDE